jgi:hypothetical protein
MFLLLISVRGLVRPEGLVKFKNSPHRVSKPTLKRQIYLPGPVLHGYCDRILSTYYNTRLKDEVVCSITLNTTLNLALHSTD